MKKHARSRYFSEQFDSIAHEISILAIACDIDIFAEDAAERLLNNDETMCRRRNTAAFQKLRRHMLALYPLEERSIERVGAEQTKELLDEVRAAFRKLHNTGRPGSAPPLDED